MSTFTVKVLVGVSPAGSARVEEETLEATGFDHDDDFTLFYGEDGDGVVASYRNDTVLSIRKAGSEGVRPEPAPIAEVGSAFATALNDIEHCGLTIRGDQIGQIMATLDARRLTVVKA